MITTRKELSEYLKVEHDIYVHGPLSDRVYMYVVNDRRIPIWRYQKRLRKMEYWFNNRHKSPFHYIMFLIRQRMKNNSGNRLGIEISENTCGIGLTIHHAGGIVINGNAQCGQNLSLHGKNCIGNRGTGPESPSKWAAPTLGNNVDMGVGASIIGSVHIADNVLIGAGAVVIKDCTQNGSTLIGIPAHSITSREK